MRIIIDMETPLGPLGPKTSMAYLERVEFALRKAADIVRDESIEEDFFGEGITIKRGTELVALMDIVDNDLEDAKQLEQIRESIQAGFEIVEENKI